MSQKNSHNAQHQPPKYAEKLLLWFLKAELAEEVLGDLDEKFYKTLDAHSVKKARKNYWYQVGQYLRPFALKKLSPSFKLWSNTIDMFKQTLKISWRNILRSKVFSSIKIGGFAVGIAACILIALYVQSELSYDKHYKNGDDIYRIANNYSSAEYSELWTNMHGPLKPVLEDNFPEIDKVSRAVLWPWGNAGENHIRPITSQNNFYEKGFFYADPELLEILEIPMVFGSQQDALTGPNTLVLSRSKAEKYFPGQNPVGQQLILNDTPEDTYTIGGVMEDFPINSHLQGDFILTLAERKYGPGTSGWCCTNYTYYTKLLPGTDKTVLEEKMLTLRDTYVLDKIKQAGETNLEDLQKHQSYYLQPVADIYLNEKNVYDGIAHGSVDLLWTFSVIAVIILLIACLNFINLSTAKSLKRAKEVGLRKVVGSVRSGLIVQYLAESVFYSLISVFLAAGLAALSLPLFNDIAGKSLQLPWTSYWFIPLLLISALIIGILSGLYPSFYLSHFNPIESLKGKVSGSGKGSVFRSVMVVFQFTATVVLLIGALVIHKQFDHYMNKSLGFEKDQVVNLQGINTLDSAERSNLKAELLKLSTVEEATLGDYLPVAGGAIQNLGYELASEKDLGNGFEAAHWVVDEDYLKTMSMQLVAGRNFTQSTSDKAGIIINERMAEMFRLEDPVGTELIDMFDNKVHVIGVVKDFHFESLVNNVRPLVMAFGQGKSTLSVKIRPENMEKTLAGIQQVWTSVKPTQPIRYSFMDDRFRVMYDDLLRVKNIFLICSVLSVIVACLGLFALSAYMIEQRGKEVSVRKVLGASVPSLFRLLATDFLKLVLLATIIAIPIGWYYMDDLLHDMANHIALDWSLFAMASGVAFIIALITISFESIKAATVNPAQKLRSE